MEHVIKVSKAKGRRIVIADIHGCVKTLKRLILEKIKLTFDDYLFFLGDYLHRGPDSAGVMDFIFELKNNQMNIFCLTGNHEQMALQKDKQSQEKLRNNIEYDNYENIPRLIKLANFTDKNRVILPQYRYFLETLPFCYELDEFYLVHAGLNLEIENPLLDKKSMILQRENNFDKVPNKKVIHGHTITSIKEIERNIESKSDFIGIDNGCYYGLESDYFLDEKKSYYGRLCALDLDNWILYTQICIDEKI